MHSFTNAQTCHAKHKCIGDKHITLRQSKAKKVPLYFFGAKTEEDLQQTGTMYISEPSFPKGTICSAWYHKDAHISAIELQFLTLFWGTMEKIAEIESTQGYIQMHAVIPEMASTCKQWW